MDRQKATATAYARRTTDRLPCGAVITVVTENTMPKDALTHVEDRVVVAIWTGKRSNGTNVRGRSGTLTLCVARVGCKWIASPS